MPKLVSEPVQVLTTERLATILGFVGWVEEKRDYFAGFGDVPYEMGKTCASIIRELIAAREVATTRATQAESRLSEAQAELGEQEVAKLEAIKELAAFQREVAEDLGFLHDSAGCISDSDMMDEIAASADRLGLQMISPAESAAPTSPTSSPAAAGPGVLSAGKLAAFGYEKGEPREPCEDEPAVGQIWRHKKTGEEVQIILRPGPYGVNYRRHPLSANSDFNRERKKRLHYFLCEYEPATTTGEGKGVAGE